MVGEKGEIRSPIMVIVLSCVTLGIYGIYWLYKSWDEIIRYRGLDKSAVVWGIVLPLCTFGIGSIVSYIMLILEIEKAQVAAGVNPPISSVLAIVLLFVFGIITIYLIQDGLNKLWQAGPPMMPMQPMAYPQQGAPPPPM